MKTLYLSALSTSSMAQSIIDSVKLNERVFVIGVKNSPACDISKEKDNPIYKNFKLVETFPEVANSNYLHEKSKHILQPAIFERFV